MTDVCELNLKHYEKLAEELKLILKDLLDNTKGENKDVKSQK